MHNIPLYFSQIEYEIHLNLLTKTFKYTRQQHKKKKDYYVKKFYSVLFTQEVT